MNNQLFHNKIILGIILGLISSFFFYTTAKSQTKHGFSKITVILTVGPDCPISQKYMHTIKGIYESYKDSVSFIGIIPNNFQPNTIKQFVADYSIPFEVKLDESNQIINKYLFSVTPEVVILKNNNIVYRGAIDNWFYDLGKNRRSVTEHYLNDVLSDITNGKSPSITQTKPIGCIIEK